MGDKIPVIDDKMKGRTPLFNALAEMVHFLCDGTHCRVERDGNLLTKIAEIRGPLMDSSPGVRHV